MKTETSLELMRIALDLTAIATRPDHATAIRYAAKRAIPGDMADEMRVYQYVLAHVQALFTDGQKRGAVAGGGAGIERQQ